MKILQIHNLYQKQGGEDVVVEIEKMLLENNGHTVLTLIPSNKNINSVIYERRKYFKLLDKLIDENPDIDIAHVHNIFSIIGPSIYDYLNKRGIPIVQTVHNFRFLCPNGLFFDNNKQICELCKHGDFKHAVIKKCYHESYLLSFLMQYQVKLARNSGLKNIDKFISLSNFTKNKLVESGFDVNKIVVKPNFLFPQPPQKVYEHDNYALFIGRLSSEKGVEVVINAFKEVDYKLKIAGTGDILDELKERGKNYPNIEFCGFVAGKEKEKLVSGASFIIVPSLQYENFPVSVLDAFSRGKTVIASRIGSLPEIIIDGFSGILFEMGNAESLKLNLLRLIKDKTYEKLGKNAYHEFLTKFQTEQNYQQLLNIYDDVIKR